MVVEQTFRANVRKVSPHTKWEVVRVGGDFEMISMVAVYIKLTAVCKLCGFADPFALGLDSDRDLLPHKYSCKYGKFWALAPLYARRKF